MSRTAEPTSPPSASLPLPTLVVFGGLATAWAVFLWFQLLEARSGGTPVCLGGSDCGALWDGAFASRIHETTALPVAAWGVLWGLLATVFPALAATRLGSRRPVFGAATVLVASAGLAGVVVLLVVSFGEGMFCFNCSLTYALTLIYGIMALPRGLGLLRQNFVPALGSAGIGLAAGWLLLLTPGKATPRALGNGLDAVAAVAEQPGDSDQGAPGMPSPEDFLAGLEPDFLQGIADSLAILEHSPTPELLPAEHYSLGDATAVVSFTEWTDVLCGHCARLHQTFEYLHTTLPADRFNLVSRQFPLDGNCNRHLEVRGDESVRCLAARAQICVEPTGHGFAYSGALFRMQARLVENPALVYRLAEPYIDRATLGACLSSPETAARLEADVDEAWKFRPRGTPLVLVDGRQGTHFGPFLYALALAGGQVDHPAFALLPPPNPEVVDATLEGADSHEGHQH